VPARYLFSGLVGFHGIFVLLRPLLFRLTTVDSVGVPDARLIDLLSQYVVLESTIALVMMAFGTVMLTNEYITTELRHLAEVDPLTSVFNRRAFLTLLEKAISQAERMRQSLPVLVLDLDHFKKINDTWGHSGGDDVLRQFVALANRCLRKEDMMGRLGGEEFAIFLPNADSPGAQAVAERLRTLVQAQPVQSGPQSIALTVSIGMALCVRGDSADAVLKRADTAMYLAKQKGRNRVEVAETPLFV
jgi:diguanylate cyclase (GGDEF)-like protein